VVQVLDDIAERTCDVEDDDLTNKVCVHRRPLRGGADQSWV
jgi:hypothetical protein